MAKKSKLKSDFRQNLKTENWGYRFRTDKSITLQYTLQYTLQSSMNNIILDCRYNLQTSLFAKYIILAEGVCLGLPYC